MLLRFLTLIILLIFVFLTGMWTSRKGRPLQVLPFTIHKIGFLAFVVLTILYGWLMIRISWDLNAGKVLLVLSGILFAVSVSTGALLSFDKYHTRPFTLTHFASSILLILLMITLSIVRILSF